MSYHSPDPSQSSSPPQTETSGRHPVNVGHLVMGVAFLGLAAIWLLFETDAIAGDDLRWLLPLPWLAGGVAGLLAVTLNSRSRDLRGPSDPAGS